MTAHCTGDLHPYASTTRSERFRRSDELTADTLAAGLLCDDQSHDPPPGTGALEERTHMHSDKAEEFAISLGDIGRTGGVARPGADPGCCRSGVVLGIAKLVKQFADGRGVGDARRSYPQGFHWCLPAKVNDTSRSITSARGNPAAAIIRG